MRKVYRFKLTSEERQDLESLTQKGKTAALKVIKARSLLLADESDAGAAWTDAKIIEATGITTATLSRLRQRCYEEGPLNALERKRQSRPSRQRCLDGEGEAQLVAIACSETPKGHAKWTLQLLADRLVELKVVDTISTETVRKTLKKTDSNLG